MRIGSTQISRAQAFKLRQFYNQATVDLEGAAKRAYTNLTDLSIDRLDVPKLKASDARLAFEKIVNEKIPKPTWYRWIRLGKIYSMRISYFLYIPKAELYRVADECRKGQDF